MIEAYFPNRKLAGGGECLGNICEVSYPNGSFVGYVDTNDQTLHFPNGSVCGFVRGMHIHSPNGRVMGYVSGSNIYFPNGAICLLTSGAHSVIECAAMILLLMIDPRNGNPLIPDPRWPDSPGF